MIGSEIDLTEFQKALDLAAMYSSRATAEVINDACLDIILKSAIAIPKADRLKMEKQLVGQIEVTTMGKSGKLLKHPKITRHPSKLIYNIINARRRKNHLPALTGEAMAKAAKAFLNARVRSIGYIAYAGFAKANRAFGGRGFGFKGEVNERSKAAQGWGRRAEPGSLWAEFVNRATEAYKVGGSIVQRIVNEKAQSMTAHVEEKLQKQFDRL